jgi:hypothetical protein
LKLAAELNDSKESNIKLKQNLHKKLEESKKVLTERKKDFEKSVDHQKYISKIETKTERQTFSKDLYYHVLRLENQLKDRDRVITEVSSENKTLDKMIKKTEEEVIKIRKEEANSQKEEIAAEHLIANLENRITELTSQGNDLQAENKMLLQIQRVTYDSDLHPMILD